MDTHAVESPSRPDPRLRLLLFGGGHGDDYRDVERMFGEWIGTDGHVLMIAAPERHPANIEWDVERLAGHLREVGVPRLTVWDESTIAAPGFAPNLEPFAGICFSAPLPHEIVPLLRSSGLDDALVEAARAGCVIYAENLLLPIFGPNLRYTALRDYRIDEYGIEDDRGLDLTTDTEGQPTIYMGRYRALPSRSKRHPQRVANETGTRVCVIPPVSMVTIRDGEVLETGRHAFAWYDPKPRRPLRRQAETKD